MAAIILSVVLLITGLAIGLDAIKNIFGGSYENLAVPGVLALVAAAISIVTKEAMYHYTKIHAKRIDSSALMADAWHHRSDAFSSIGALIGIAGARMGFPILDPIASLVICIFIAKAAIDICKDAINKMVECSCDEDTEKALHDFAAVQDGVLCVDFLQTRVFGNKIYVDVEISADGNSTLNEAHAIAEKVHDAIEATFPKVKHIMVHVNPYME